MKTIIAASILVLSGTASADWENAWGTDELAINHEGHVTEQSMTVDPIASSGFASGNSELQAGVKSDGSSAGRTAHEDLSSALAEYGA
jgi:hypothetical protein